MQPFCQGEKRIFGRRPGFSAASSDVAAQCRTRRSVSAPQRVFFLPVSAPALAGPPPQQGTVLHGMDVR